MRTYPTRTTLAPSDGDVDTQYLIERQLRPGLGIRRTEGTSPVVTEHSHDPKSLVKIVVIVGQLGSQYWTRYAC